MGLGVIRTRNAALDFLVIGHLLVCRNPGVNDERLAVSDVGQVACHLEIVDHGTDLLDFSSLKPNVSIFMHFMHNYSIYVAAGNLPHQRSRRHLLPLASLSVPAHSPDATSSQGIIPS